MEDLVEVGIHGIDGLEFPALDIGVADDDDIPPTHAGIVGEGDEAVADAVNGGAEVAVAALDIVPILARVVILPAARHVIAVAIGLSDGQVKTVGDTDIRAVRGRDGRQPRDEQQQEYPEQPASHEPARLPAVRRAGQAAGVVTRLRKPRNRLRARRFGLF